MFRVSSVLLHGRLRFPIGSGVVNVGYELLPLLPSNEFYYNPAKLRSKFDQDGYLYFKKIIPTEVVHAALDSIATQMLDCGWTIAEDREKQADRDGFALGIPYPSHLLQSSSGGQDTAGLPPPSIQYTPEMRAAVSGSSVMTLVRQIFGGAVHAAPLQTMNLGAPSESFGFRMPSVFMNRGTKLSIIAVVPLHDTPLHMGAPVVVRGSNSTESYSKIRQTYGQHEVEGGNISGDGCFTDDPQELLPIGKRLGVDSVTGLSTTIDENPFVSTAMEVGDVLLLTVYTMHANLTNRTNCWRVSAESIWTMDGDDVGPDPRYVGDDAVGLGSWYESRDDKTLYPRTMKQAKKDWGLIPGVPTPPPPAGSSTD